MKLLPFSIAAQALLLITSIAYAGETAELKVSGKIRPAACSMALSGGGLVDYGKVYDSQLSNDRLYPTKLADKNLTLSINCDGPVKIAFSLTDNQASSTPQIPNMRYSEANVEFLYGLGTFQGKKLGGYSVVMGSPMVDNASGYVAMLQPENGAAYWGSGWYQNRVPLSPSGKSKYGWTSYQRTNGAQSYQVVPYTNYVATLTVTAYLLPKQYLPTGDDIPFSGSASLEVIYL